MLGLTFETLMTMRLAHTPTLADNGFERIVPGAYP